MSKRPEEYGKRCGLCRKNTEAHTYPFPVRGTYIKLCGLCWDIIDARRNGGRMSDENKLKLSENKS